MRKKIILSLLLLASYYGFGQEFFQTTTNSIFSNKNIRTSGKISLGNDQSESLGKAKINIQSNWGNWMTLIDGYSNDLYKFHNPQNGGRLELFIYDKANDKYRWGAFTLKNNGNVGIGTTNPLSKLHLNGDLYINSGIDDNHIYWGAHNMTMGTRVGDYAHNVLNLKPGGADQGKLFSLLRIYSNHTGSAKTNSLEFRIHNGSGNVREQVGVMTLNGEGNVGIGTTAPNTKLHINDNTSRAWGDHLKISSDSDKYGIAFTGKGHHRGGVYADNSGGNTGKGNITVWARNGGNVNLNPDNGNVGIGTKNTKGFKLGVNGKIAATEVKVALYDNWSDFVFYKDYKLPTLEEVETHISQSGHLKDIPSAKEVAKDGIFLGQMDAKLLQKIEELTLYTIQQDKQLKAQDQKIELLLQRLEKLEATK